MQFQAWIMERRPGWWTNARAKLWISLDRNEAKCIACISSYNASNHRVPLIDMIALFPYSSTHALTFTISHPHGFVSIPMIIPCGKMWETFSFDYVIKYYDMVFYKNGASEYTASVPSELSSCLQKGEPVRITGICGCEPVVWSEKSNFDWSYRSNKEKPFRSFTSAITSLILIIASSRDRVRENESTSAKKRVRGKAYKHKKTSEGRWMDGVGGRQCTIDGTTLWREPRSTGPQPTEEIAFVPRISCSSSHGPNPTRQIYQLNPGCDHIWPWFICVYLLLV